MSSVSGNDPLNNRVYDELGLRPVIHAAGTITSYGGSEPRPEVMEAMAQASQSFIGLLELNEKVGEYIAQVSGAEAGMVVKGAAGGVVLSMAACMTGTNPAKVRQLPNTEGMKDELIIQKIHRGGYSDMYGFTGAKLIEVGSIDGTLEEELEAAFTDQTAAVNYLFGPGLLQKGLSLSKVSEIAHAHGVPVIVDAAAMLPPKSNLRRYISDGADLVTFSGGKFIRGPQGTGLLFGRKDLIDAAIANGPPNHSIGRPQKVTREEMVGLYTALKLFMEQDDVALMASYRTMIEPAYEVLQGLDGVRVSIEHDPIKHHVPTVVVRLNSESNGVDPQKLLGDLLEGDPRVFVTYDRGDDSVAINPINLRDGQAEVVAARLLELLG
ncbi:MAG: aminotransferase class V-fold PLP-dependent enzyme [Chloroflexi bacterium]|jgi:L-seryl-tRNA(Ser) seleniumtransferase|nr:aminotransferase class V-fold PLP-dependent enzyme [Chloroflexota bacterium]